MRYEEYYQDKNKAREAAMIIESREKELDENSLLDIQLMLPLQTVAIGTHHHICRQKTRGKDELFKRLVKLMGKFYVEIRVPLEGGKITRWKSLVVKIKRLF